jgi:hypothetical protein
MLTRIPHTDTVTVKRGWLKTGVSMRALLGRMAMLFGLTALLAACGPIYDTQYTYSAPTSARGQACVSSCEADKSGCTYSCRRRTQDCENEKEMIADREYNRYARWRQNQGLPVDRTRLSFMPGYSCPWESECTDVCDAEYRACFTGCGGRIDAQQVCVMGCNQK